MKSGRPASGVRCNEVPAKKFTAARIYRFLSMKWRAVKSGEQKFTAKGTLRGGLRVQTSLQLQMFLRQTCLLAEGYFWGRFCYLERQKVATLCFLSLIFLRRTWYLAEGTFAAAVNNEVWGVGFGGPLQ